jgi:hypothetical protein
LLWAAELLALLFALESGLLLALAAVSTVTPPEGGQRISARRSASVALVLFSVLGLPAFQLALGRDWTALALVGTAPARQHWQRPGWRSCYRCPQAC